MALAIWELVSAPGDLEIELDMYYAPARYRPGGVDQGVVEVCGPVIPELAGWSARPEDPLSLLLGVGYEVEKAMGAIEYLEVGDVWIFRPRGIDERYDRDVDKANETLREFVKTDRVVDYPVLSPYLGCVKLESLISGLAERNRVLLIPFGPKIFAGMCLLISCLRGGDVGVWRISGGATTPPVDHAPSGQISVLRSRFSAVPG
jgi:hypothetical protein